MIRRFQALNFRCLRYVDVALDRFHVLVGPNASGKSTVFDALDFLGDMMRGEIDSAVDIRSDSFRDLVWNRPHTDGRLELAVEFDVPDAIRDRLPAAPDFRTFRYEVAIGVGDDGPRIESERGILRSFPNSAQADSEQKQRTLFPDPMVPPRTLLTQGGRRGARTILSKSPEGRDSFNVETTDRSGQGWVTNISFGPRRSALGHLPESPDNFPMATYVKHVLDNRLKFVFLDSADMRAPSPPNRRRSGLGEDGSGLPWCVRKLQEGHPDIYREWLRHVQTALPDLEGICVVQRPEDLHAYLMLSYTSGVEVPSWVASDGTIRFLALTLLAYLPDPDNVYVLEEPENGIHPLAIDAVYSSLSSVYDSQVLVATHSPVFLGLAEPGEVLCFARNDDGATDIVHGNDHPLLQDWRNSMDMNVLFATGVIG
ncbi:MAG: AAA family ATPase [Alphaproteobacteria bacterium]|nr:AAA family ATPase [Alphaproteobacteria bacterium]